ncbi:MAG: GNAT family N-acetyltransferase [Chitinophagaceae bacterium]|nr:MAG: GNAT family N-acetyltransferase [Chitinophagaceae bacterium]
MEDLLYNPVYNALAARDAHLGNGTSTVRYYDEAVAPFAGFPTNYQDGFRELHDLLPPGRQIVFARPDPIEQPAGWSLKTCLEGLQFIFPDIPLPPPADLVPQPLGSAHIDEMVELVKLTRPGPFAKRTIEFGHYHGFFDNGKLVAMTGQRMHVGNYNEISAVCTHPDHLGKGYAAALIVHQLHLIRSQGRQAFLHVKADNTRAVALYNRLGFSVNRPMYFYFMQRA